jgi:hypothetical protein
LLSEPNAILHLLKHLLDEAATLFSLMANLKWPASSFATW